MNNSIDVGALPEGFRGWESRTIRFHGFADLPSESGVDVVESPEFACLGNTWRLDIWPGGDTSAHEGEVSFYLYNTSADSIALEYYFQLKNSARKVVVSGPMAGPLVSTDPLTCTFTSSGSEDDNDGFDKNRSTIIDALVDGTMALEVWMRNAVPVDVSPPQFIPENPLCKNILKMFMDEESADIVFEVVGENRRGGRSRKKAKTTSSAFFHAHHFILQRGASDLAELCKPVGGKPTTVQITGVKPTVFRLLLLHVYGGRIPDEELKENAKDVIDATDKYGVVSLKLAAEACYVESTTLTVDNVLDNLLYADSKNCALLKEAVMDFIVTHKYNIMGKVSFDNIPGGLVNDLLAAVARGEKEDGVQKGSSYHRMRVGALRKLLHEKGLDVDGSREAMIALLEVNSGPP